MSGKWTAVPPRPPRPPEISPLFVGPVPSLEGEGLNRSGVDPPLSSSRACLTTFIAISVP